MQILNPIMNAHRPFFCFAFGILPSVLWAQFASPPPNSATAPIELEPFVVSSGFDDKTAFDLAQGTSILAGADLRRLAKGTLGETLGATPGINSTYHGPGASRPVIRGLGGDRIRVLQNGIGILDASNVSPDHNAAVEPLFAERIEVLRGPATLLYGSSAIGGAVNVIDNRIPNEALDGNFSGSLEMRGGGAAFERAGLAALKVGNKSFAMQVDGLKLRAGDVRIPGVARIDDEAPSVQPLGTLPNSDISTESHSLGATWFGSLGHIGAALTRYDTDYGVPTDEPISISMQQRRFDLAAELSRPLGVIRGAKARFGIGDYTHAEIADGMTVNTTIRNKAWEGRLELPHTFSKGIDGTIGAQGSRSDFSAVGEEVVFPASVTTNAAVFALEEWKHGPVTCQAGARLEGQSIKVGDVDPSLPRVPGYDVDSGERKNRTGVNGSIGAVYYPARQWAVGLSLAYSERLPTAQELFSNGPHGGTGSWEIGTGNLGNEKSVGVDLSVRKRSGFVSGSVSAFINRFKGYIFAQKLPLSTIPEELNEEGLTPYQFTARDALFYGGEAEAVVHLLEREDFKVHVQITWDYVHAEQTTDDAPLPRVPPMRFGAALRYDGIRWHAGVELRTANRQDRIVSDETMTPGYTFLDVDMAYVIPIDRSSIEIFVRGTNLTNREARVHSSFLKDFSPLPGRGVLAGVRLTF